MVDSSEPGQQQDNWCPLGYIYQKQSTGESCGARSACSTIFAVFEPTRPHVKAHFFYYFGIQKGTQRDCLELESCKKSKNQKTLFAGQRSDMRFLG